MAVFLIPKTNAELNQIVSILHSSGYNTISNVSGAVGKKVTVWLNIHQYVLDTQKYFNDHREIRPNELYALIHKVK